MNQPPGAIADLLGKGIVEAYGGTVSAESTQGQGTTISVRLPADRS